MDIRAALPLLLLAGALVPCGPAGAAEGRLTLSEMPSPAGPGAVQAALTPAGDGSIRLSWLEPDLAGGWALRCAAFDRSGGKWRTPVAVAAGSGFALGPGDLPAFAAGPGGRAALAWTAASADGQSQRVMISQSRDGGATWSPPSLLSRPGADAAGPALATLAGGRIAAAWVDRSAGLCLRLLDAEAAPDLLLDAGAAGGQPSLAPLLDGGVLAAYRGRLPGGAWQPRLARWPRSWSEAHAIDTDPEDAGSGPGGGPRISADGGRVAAVWAAGGHSEGRLLVTASPDAGIRFQLPVTAGGGGAPDRPAAAILHDGAILVAWVEGSDTDGGNRLRLGRFNPDLRPAPAPITPAGPSPSGSPPQIVLLRDYAGSGASAEALVVFGAGPKPSRLRVLRVTVEEGALLAAADDDCRCAPTPAQLAGYPVRGAITDVRPAAGTLTLDLDAAPGVMEPGPQVFQASAAILAAARVGRQCLGRIEREGSGWRFFDLRLLEETP